MMFFQLFFVFLKIGLFTIGGGYAMIPMIRNEVVLNFEWISEIDFVNFIAIAESTPGPFAINMATYVGFAQGGVLGAICTTLGVVLPSLVIIMVIAKLFVKFSNNKTIKNLFWGFRPVVAGLICSAAATLFCAVVFPNVSLKEFKFDFSNANFWSIGIFAVVMILSRLKIKNVKINPILLVVISGVMGVLIFGVMPKLM